VVPGGQSENCVTTWTVGWVPTIEYCGPFCPFGPKLCTAHVWTPTVDGAVAVIGACTQLPAWSWPEPPVLRPTLFTEEAEVHVPFELVGAPTETPPKALATSMYTVRMCGPCFDSLVTLRLSGFVAFVRTHGMITPPLEFRKSAENVRLGAALAEPVSPAIIATMATVVEMRANCFIFPPPPPRPFDLGDTGYGR
jgi:hypothetical protein